ncbi:MAG: putative NAD/FAD-binding protein [Myxococcota bacterium]|jgi:predicted NAD/FAD-binding protein
MRIAIVGSGIAGLTASWTLGKSHDVTIIEKQTRHGMAAHSLEIGSVPVDVPLRVFYAGYYPELLELYDEAGIETEAVDYSTSFAHVGGDTYFRYKNIHVGGSAIPVPRSTGPEARRILADMARFLARDRNRVQPDETVGEFFNRTDYSTEFVDGFLLPAFAGIATVPYDRVRDYPGHVVADYMTGGILLQSVRRTVRGSRFVVERLTSRAVDHQRGCEVTQIHPSNGASGGAVDVVDSSGRRQAFDHVIVATQANQALRFVDHDGPEASALNHFGYDTSRVVTHTDPRLAPRDRSSWSPVNFLVSPDHDAPMASIWMNAVVPGLTTERPVFQTWNPLVEPDPTTILGDVTLQRPAVSTTSEAGLAALDRLHDTPNRRIWFVGSYAAAGVPLLESATRSARSVARRINLQGV